MNYSKQDEVVIPSDSRTATGNYTFSSGTIGGLFVIDVTSVTDTPSVTFTIQGVEPISGNTWDILASSAISTTGTTVLRVHPSLPDSSNATEQDILPQAININADHDDTDAITYSVRFIGVS